MPVESKAFAPTVLAEDLKVRSNVVSAWLKIREFTETGRVITVR